MSDHLNYILQFLFAMTTVIASGRLNELLWCHKLRRSVRNQTTIIYYPTTTLREDVAMLPLYLIISSMAMESGCIIR